MGTNMTVACFNLVFKLTLIKGAILCLTCTNYYINFSLKKKNSNIFCLYDVLVEVENYECGRVSLEVSLRWNRQWNRGMRSKDCWFAKNLHGNEHPADWVGCAKLELCIWYIIEEPDTVSRSDLLEFLGALI